MQNQLNTNDFLNKFKSSNDSTVYTAVGMKLTSDPNKYEVKRWLSYIVPKNNDWAPWKEQDLDYDYGNWRILHLRQNISNFEEMLNSWFNKDIYKLSDDALTFIKLVDDLWESQKTWSRQNNSYRTIPYPASWYRPINCHEMLHPEDDLIATNLPYFPSTKEAFALLIDGVELRNITNRTLDGFKYGVFVLEDAPFIKNVSIHADRFEVTISGGGNKICELKTFSDLGTIHVQTVSHSRKYTIQWNGLPNYAVWALTSEHEIFDKVVYYRHPTFGTNGNVEVNLSKESTLDALVESGEGQDIEFKRNFPKDKNDKEFLETVCAFANTNNGVIIIGVSDDGEIHGIGKTLPEKYEESLSNKIRNSIDPVPNFHIKPQKYHDTWVVIVKIEKGDKVYALNAASKPLIYKRHGSNDFIAKLSELSYMFANNEVLIKNPLPSNHYLNGYAP